MGLSLNSTLFQATAVPTPYILPEQPVWEHLKNASEHLYNQKGLTCDFIKNAMPDIQSRLMKTDHMKAYRMHYEQRSAESCEFRLSQNNADVFIDHIDGDQHHMMIGNDEANALVETDFLTKMNIDVKTSSGETLSLRVQRESIDNEEIVKLELPDLGVSANCRIGENYSSCEIDISLYARLKLGLRNIRISFNKEVDVTGAETLTFQLTKIPLLPVLFSEESLGSIQIKTKPKEEFELVMDTKLFPPQSGRIHCKKGTGLTDFDCQATHQLSLDFGGKIDYQSSASFSHTQLLTDHNLKLMANRMVSRESQESTDPLEKSLMNFGAEANCQEKESTQESEHIIDCQYSAHVPLQSDDVEVASDDIDVNHAHMPVPSNDIDVEGEVHATWSPKHSHIVANARKKGESAPLAEIKSTATETENSKDINIKYKFAGQPEKEENMSFPKFEL